MYSLSIYAVAECKLRIAQYIFAICLVVLIGLKIGFATLARRCQFPHFSFFSQKVASTLTPPVAARSHHLDFGAPMKGLSRCPLLLQHTRWWKLGPRSKTQGSRLDGKSNSNTTIPLAHSIKGVLQPDAHNEHRTTDVNHPPPPPPGMFIVTPPP